MYSTQKQLGKDAQLAAAEIVRRAERGIGVAIRRGQQTGEIARRGDRGGGAAGVHGGNPNDRRDDHLGSPGSFFRHADERADTYAMTDGISDTDFEDALGEAKAEGNLSRANVVRKIRQRRTAAPPGPRDQARRAAAPPELIARHAAAGMSSRQIGEPARHRQPTRCGRSPASTASKSRPTRWSAGPGARMRTGSCGRPRTPWMDWP